MKKRLLIENDVKEMADFQKILLLNKRKLSPDDVEFITRDYDIDLDKVQVKPDGLLFDFDDLEQFLKFFHYPAFEEGSDGEWDAINYDRMYYGQYDFYFKNNSVIEPMLLRDFLINDDLTVLTNSSSIGVLLPFTKLVHSCPSSPIPCPVLCGKPGNL